MAHIGCTAKLLKTLKIPTPHSIEPAANADSQFHWHANLLMVNRRPCVLFVHDLSLFNLMIPDFPVNQPDYASDVFLSWLSTVLQDTDTPKHMIETFLKGHASLKWGKTSSRSVLGSMNEFMIYYEHAIDEIGGIDSYQFPAQIQRMNHITMKAIDYQHPINRLQAILKDMSGDSSQTNI